MPYDLLSGLCIVEVSAFIAAPLAGLTLAQLGAEVIRIDPPGGSIDAARLPLGPDGRSLYWAGLNRAKTSVTLDLKSPQGQSVLHDLLRGGGDRGGILLTNLTGPDWLSYDVLRQVRPDLILVDLKGHHDGAGAVDYTVNSAVGVPMLTGPVGATGPVNHQLPAWDAAAGLSLSTAILAALLARGRDGQGRHLSVALSDVAYAFMGNIGALAEVQLTGTDRPRIGNHIYGAFGIDLPSSDGRYAMVVAITARQWQSLVAASGSADAMARVATETGADLTAEPGRWHAREAIAAVLRDWSAGLDMATLAAALDANHVLWGPYRTMTQMLAEDPRMTTANPMIHEMDGLRLPGSAIRVNGVDEGALTPAPVQGQDTAALLARLAAS